MSRSPVKRVRDAVWLWRTLGSRDQTILLVLFAVLAVVYAFTSAQFPSWVPASSAVLLIIVAGYFLQLRFLMLFYLLLAPSVLVSGLLRVGGTRLPPGVVILLVVAALMMAAFVRTREELGVQGNTGQAMLVDLRDRLRAQAVPAALPAGVGLEVAQLSANGEGFSGDFVLSAVRPTADELSVLGGTSVDWPGALEVVVVDVSGKGQAVGTRALLLSGGLSGLLGGPTVAHFLPAANAYLLRQGWPEGFATAIHVVVEPATGRYAVRSAGHPPPLQHRVGSGVWEPLGEAPDPALGLVPHETYTPVCGKLEYGDALVVYTDGVVESRVRDLGFGVDRLAGRLSRYVRKGYRGAAAAVVNVGPAGASDDRTLVVLWRE